jgi:hypothetical protein
VGTGQALVQLPQRAGLVLRFVSQPAFEPPLVLQSPKPALHAKLQVPVLQLAVWLASAVQVPQIAPPLPHSVLVVPASQKVVVTLPTFCDRQQPEQFVALQFAQAVPFGVQVVCASAP